MTSCMQQLCLVYLQNMYMYISKRRSWFFFDVWMGVYTKNMWEAEHRLTSPLSNRINHRSAHTCDNHIFQPRLVRGKRIHWNAKDIYRTKIRIFRTLCLYLLYLIHSCITLLQYSIKTWNSEIVGHLIFTWSILLDWGLLNWSSRSSFAQFAPIYKMSTRAPFLSNCTHLLMNISCIYTIGNVHILQIWWVLQLQPI